MSVLPDPASEESRTRPRMFSRRDKSTLELEPAKPGEGRDIPIVREELVVVQRPTSQQAEQFRRLRNNVHALNPDGASRSVLVTSALKGEGKTVATLNLALALTELPGIRVLIIDGNIQNPSIEHYLGLPRRQGFYELLQGTLPLEQGIRRTPIERLDVLATGAVPRLQSDFLNVDRMRAVLDAVKRSYDYVLLDAPAVLAANQPSVMGTVADGILLVVRRGTTPRQYVEEAYAMLENLGGNVLGTCLVGALEPDQTEL